MNKRLKNRICFAAIIFIAILLISCSRDGRRPFWEADISSIHIASPHIKRYEKALFSIDPKSIQDSLNTLHNAYAIFLERTLDDPSAQERLYAFITDPDIRELFNDTEEQYDDLNFLVESLERSFRFHRYHFPDSELPELYTYISGVDYVSPVKHSGNHLVIGLDNYLGSDYPLYEKLGIPRYLAFWMRPERIVVDVMIAMADQRLATYASIPETLLDHMIYYGKRQYILDCLLPRMHDTLKIAYTGNKFNWMKQYSGYAWTYKLDNNLLYTTDHRTIIQFTGEAPFTSAFGRDSAPRSGVWLGWQIVREYMRRNPDIGLIELLAEDDARKILTEARYRP